MIASIAVLSLFTTAVLGQSSTASADVTIPTDASASCQNFMKKMNSDKQLDACATSMISASSAYSPGNYTDAPTASGISQVLDGLCSATCDAEAVRTSLTDFYSACSSELTSDSVDEVLITYDVLYSLIPFKNAMCTKNDAGNYCLLQSATSSSSSLGANAAYAGSSKVDTTTVAEYLTNNPANVRRAEAVVTTPNATTFQSANILFLFLNGSAPASTLCTSCTTNIMSAWMEFEAALPYAPGLAQSPLISGQSDLYKGIISQCGNAFLSSAVQAAGGISSGPGSDSSDAPRIRESLVGTLGGLALVSLFL